MLQPTLSHAVASVMPHAELLLDHQCAVLPLHRRRHHVILGRHCVMTTVDEHRRELDLWNALDSLFM